MVLLLKTPYIRGADDRLQMLAQFDIFLLLTIQHTYSVEGAPSPGSTVDIALSAFLILLSIIILLIFVYNVITYIRTAVWTIKRKAQEDQERRVVPEPDFEESKSKSVPEYSDARSPSPLPRSSSPNPRSSSRGELHQNELDQATTSGGGGAIDSFILNDQDPMA